MYNMIIMIHIINKIKSAISIAKKGTWHLKIFCGPNLPSLTITLKKSLYTTTNSLLNNFVYLYNIYFNPILLLLFLIFYLFYSC